MEGDAFDARDAKRLSRRPGPETENKIAGHSCLNEDVSRTISHELIPYFSEAVREGVRRVGAGPFCVVCTVCPRDGVSYREITKPVSGGACLKEKAA